MRDTTCWDLGDVSSGVPLHTRRTPPGDPKYLYSVDFMDSSSRGVAGGRGEATAWMEEDGPVTYPAKYQLMSLLPYCGFAS